MRCTWSGPQVECWCFFKTLYLPTYIPIYSCIDNVLGHIFWSFFCGTMMMLLKKKLTTTRAPPINLLHVFTSKPITKHFRWWTAIIRLVKIARRLLFSHGEIVGNKSSASPPLLVEFTLPINWLHTHTKQWLRKKHYIYHSCRFYRPWDRHLMRPSSWLGSRCRPVGQSGGRQWSAISFLILSPLLVLFIT